MEAHDLWHLVVLGTTLFGAAGLLIYLAGPLIFERRREAAWLRGVLGFLLAGAALLLAVEWLVVH